eukprot:131636_1
MARPLMATNCSHRIRCAMTQNLHRHNQRWTSTTSKQYGVLVTGGPPEHIQQFGDYGDMMINMLSDKTQKNESWTKYYCFDDEFPSDDELQNLSGVVITGSRFDAQGHDPWICKLRDLIRRVHDKGIRSRETKLNDVNGINRINGINGGESHTCRILGICFGHEIVSNALDGESGPTESGWQLGVQHIALNDDFYKQFPSITSPSLPILKLHHDQVTKLPSNATVLASSWNVPFEMYNIGDNVLCVQGHPEFDAKYLGQVVQYRNNDETIPDKNTIICMESIRMTDCYTYSGVTQWNSLLRSWLVR